MACAGDIPTTEALAATALLRENFPELKVRFINIVDLFKLEPETEHLHGLSKSRSDRPWRCSVSGSSLNRSTMLMKRTLSSGKFSRSRAVAARASVVGMSPAHAITTSGALPWSLLAQSQMAMPLEQCWMASSMFRYCG